MIAPAGTYSVARDDLYLRELLFEFVSPPPTLAPSTSHVLGGPSPNAPTSSADLMVMGFPQLVQATYPAICSCHHKLKSTGYSCPRCKSRICDVPTECKVCGLTVVNAPQLARSYRHLFPVGLRPVSLCPFGADPPSLLRCPTIPSSPSRAPPTHQHATPAPSPSPSNLSLRPTCPPISHRLDGTSAPSAVSSSAWSAISSFTTLWVSARVAVDQAGRNGGAERGQNEVGQCKTAC